MLSRALAVDAPVARAFDSSATAMALVSLEGRIVRANDALYRILGWEQDALLGVELASLSHPDDRALDATCAARLLRGEISEYAIERRYLHHEGHIVPGRLEMSLLRDGSGAPSILHARIQDVARRPRAELGAFVEACPDLVVVADAEGRVELANGRWGEVFGWTREEITARPFAELVHPDDRSDGREPAGVPRVFTGTNRVRAHDGSFRWLDWRTREVEPGMYFCIARDVTTSKELEEALRFHSAVVDTMGKGVALVRMDDDVIVYANAELGRMLNHPTEAIVGRPFRDLSGEPAPRRAREGASAEEVEPPKTFECELRRSDGTVLLAHGVRARLSDSPHGPLQILVFRDITAQRRAELALAEAEERFRLAFEEAPIGMALLTPELTYLRVNRALSEMLGYTSAELLGKSEAELTHPDDRLLGERIGFGSLVAGRTSRVELEKRALREDGRVVHVRVTGSAVREANGAVRYLVSQVEDVTAQREARDAIERLQREVERRSALYRTMVDNLPNGAVFLVDERMRFLSAGGPALLKSGRTAEALVGKLPRDVVSPDNFPVLDRVYRAALSGERARDEIVSGGRFYEVRSAPIEGEVGARGLVLAYDVTEHHQLADELRRTIAEKELLLAEVHHRVKNNLQIVESLLRIHRGRLDDPRVTPALDQVSARIRTIALLHERAYGAKNVGRIAMAEYVESLCLGVARMVDDPRIRLVVGPSPVTLDLDRAMPAGLIVNELVWNAFKHAFPKERTHGTIDVRIESQDDIVTITVSDDGVGVPPDRAASPDRTTGHSLVRSLARQLGATFAMEGPPGTRGILRFPH